MIGLLKNDTVICKGATPTKPIFLWLCLVIFCSPIPSLAQSLEENTVIDSLIMRLSVLDQSPEKADVLLEISNEYSDNDCSRAKEYAELALNLSDKIDYKQGQLEAADRVGDLLLSCELNIVSALKYYDEAMRLAIMSGNEEKELDILKNIAYCSYYLEEYDKAVVYYEKAVEFALKQQNTEEAVNIYGYLGSLYLDQGDTASCLDYFEMIWTIESQTDFEETEPANLLIISNYFSLQKEYALAETFAHRALRTVEKAENYRWIVYAVYMCGTLKMEQGFYNQAIAYAQKGVMVAEERGLNKGRLDNYKLLADAYKANQQFEEAVIYMDKHFELKDSLDRLEQFNRREQFKTQVDNVLQQRESEKTKNKLLAKDLEAKNYQLLVRSIALLLIVTIVFLFLLYQRLRRGNRLNRKLEQQQEQLQKLSIVAANIEQMVMIVGNDDRIEWVNNAFEKKFGFLKFEAINRTPYELLGGEVTSLERVQEINRQIFEDKIAFEATLTQYAKSGKSYLTRLHVSPILNEERDLERYIVISHDITEQQKVSEELKELSLVASNTTNSIVIFNHNMQIIWVNDSFTNISGLSTDSVLGRSPLDIYNGPLMSEEEKAELIHLYKLKEPFTIELESTNRITNCSFWISMSVTPVFTDDGVLLKYISVATDITEIKALEEQYESLVEGSIDMIYETDIAGYFVFANDVLVGATGYTKEELKDKHYLEFIREDYQQVAIELYRNQIINMEETTYMEFPIVTKEKGEFWVGSVAQLKKDLSGERAAGFKVISRDITDKKEADEKLKKAYDNASLLGEIGMQITSTHSVNEIINNVYGTINKLMDANVFGIAIPNKSNDRLYFPHVLENGKALKDFGFDLDDDKRLGVICFKESKEIAMDNFIEEYKEYVPGEEVIAPVAGDMAISLIYMPLISKGNTIGVLTVQSFKSHAYDEFQLSLIRSLASFVAIAMENATLYETMEEKIAQRTQEVRNQKEELEVNYFNTRLLSEIGQLVASTLDLGEILEDLYQRVGQLMDAEIFAVRIYNPEDNTLEFKYTMENGKRCEPFTISMDEEDNYNVWCIKNQKEILIRDNKKEFGNYVKEIQVLQGEMPNSLIFYPMIVEQKMIGVVTIQSFKYNAYQEYHLDILKTLASYIGTVIDNSALYNTLEKKVEERTEELAQKNNDITASINYAKRLQKGILPAKSFMQQLLPESFVYFKPKDIVSGDFYWVDRTPARILIAVVDCTGHGVPGAMMSIIGRNLLDQAVNEKGITMPSQILNFLQVGLSLAFGQTGDGKVELFDGMDLSLCSIDLKRNVLEFAGANNSLYLVQDDELIVLKGDKVGISAEYEISNAYTNLEIDIQKGDVIYLSSDGFPDQFGGPRYKKYTYGRMQELFKRIYTKDMSEQYDIVKQEIRSWKGERDQTDDICVMGVRL